MTSSNKEPSNLTWTFVEQGEDSKSAAENAHWTNRVSGHAFGLIAGNQDKAPERSVGSDTDYYSYPENPPAYETLSPRYEATLKDEKKTTSENVPVLSTSTTSNIRMIRSASTVNNTCGGRLSLSTRNAMDELRMLELKYVDQVLCATCSAFHKRPIMPSSNSSSHQQPQLFDIGGSECIANNQALQFGDDWTIPWWLAHSIMRFYRLSPQHGVPVTIIPQATSERHYPWRRCIEPRIVSDRLGDRLLLWIQSSQKFAGVQVHFSSPPLCSHVRSITLEEHLRTLHLGRTSGERTSSHFRCTKCPSEFRIVLSDASDSVVSNSVVGSRVGNHIPAKLPTNVVLHHWVDLGTCDSVQSPEWNSLMTERDEDRPFWPRPYKMKGLSSIASRYHGIPEDGKIVGIL